MKVLVTGGAGFIGANLCARLIDDPAVSEVRVLDDLSSGRTENLRGLPVQLTVGSILDTDEIQRSARGVDAIVHLAAIASVPRSVADPLLTHRVNATGALNALEAARTNDAYFVLASSSSVYGDHQSALMTENLPPKPVSPYAVSKLAAEQYAMAYAACYDLAVLPFRLFNVFGPLQAADHAYAAVIPAWFDAANGGRPLLIRGDGQQTRDFTSVRTVTEVLALAIRGRISHSPVNLAFGTRTSLLDLANEIERVVGHQLARHHEGPRRGDIAHSQASPELVRQLFPDVTPTRLREELARTWEWMQRAAMSGCGTVQWAL